MLSMQDVVDNQRTEHRAGQSEIHAVVADDRHKEAEEIGAEPYAEVKEDEERCSRLGKAGTRNQRAIRLALPTGSCRSPRRG